MRQNLPKSGLAHTKRQRTRVLAYSWRRPRKSLGVCHHKAKHSKLGYALVCDSQRQVVHGGLVRLMGLGFGGFIGSGRCWSKAGHPTSSSILNLKPPRPGCAWLVLDLDCCLWCSALIGGVLMAGFDLWFAAQPPLCP